MANVLCENCTLVSVDGDADAIIKICFIHCINVVVVPWMLHGHAYLGDNERIFDGVECAQSLLRSRDRFRVDTFPNV